MGKRSSTKPLYELMMTGQEPVRPTREPARAEPEATREPRIGRAVRVPLGYLFLAAALVIGLTIAAYMVGSTRSEKRLRAEYDQQLLEAGAVTWRATDPLRQPEGTPGGTSERVEPRLPSSPAAGAARADGGSGTTGAAERRWPGIESDPRVDDLHYLVLIETRREGAVRLATYCRERGLEAYVISGHNPRNRRVIALPGVPSPADAGPGVRRLLDEVQKVGRAWKNEFPGETDLRDSYWIRGAS